MAVTKEKKVKKPAASGKAEKKKTIAKKKKSKKYIEAVGRRKEAVARVRFMQDTPGFSVNGKALDAYFPLPVYQMRIMEPFQVAQAEKKFFVSVLVKGGGVNGQVEAIRLGVSRCLVKSDEKLKSALRQGGFLTRDSRVVERKKYGFKKARKSAQWSKR